MPRYCKATNKWRSKRRRTAHFANDKRQQEALAKIPNRKKRTTTKRRKKSSKSVVVTRGSYRIAYEGDPATATIRFVYSDNWSGDWPRWPGFNEEAAT